MRMKPQSKCSTRLKKAPLIADISGYIITAPGDWYFSITRKEGGPKLPRNCLELTRVIYKQTDTPYMMLMVKKKASHCFIAWHMHEGIFLKLKITMRSVLPM